ncbi:MAG: hypothetical protein LC643_05840 [Bacteroidales bacterium]|nr:hypothetical protein [Bacteroidales bacterium]
MPHYNEVYISPSDFEALVSLGIPYDGFIVGVGYAYTYADIVPPRHLQKNNPPGSAPYNESFYQMFFVQNVDDSPHVRLMSEKMAQQLAANQEVNDSLETTKQNSSRKAIEKLPDKRASFLPIVGCKPHGPMIFFGHEVWPSEANDLLTGKRDAANTGYTNWSWESDDVQVPLKVLSILTTGGAAIKAQGITRVISLVSVGHNVIGLTGFDNKIPGYNNPYFSAARDAVFVAGNLKNVLGVFETPAFIIDSSISANSFSDLLKEIDNE